MIFIKCTSTRIRILYLLKTEDGVCLSNGRVLDHGTAMEEDNEKTGSESRANERAPN